MATRKQMKQRLEQLGLEEAIADENATSSGNPAILLQWNGKTEYYLGFGIDEADPQLQDSIIDYEYWLQETFKD